MANGSDTLMLAGSDCSHWDDESFPPNDARMWSEVMTPLFRASDQQLLTRVTIAAMEDIGYKVDYSQADEVP